MAVALEPCRNPFVVVAQSKHIKTKTYTHVKGSQVRFRRLQPCSIKYDRIVMVGCARAYLVQYLSPPTFSSLVLFPFTTKNDTNLLTVVPGMYNCTLVGMAVRARHFTYDVCRKRTRYDIYVHKFELRKLFLTVLDCFTTESSQSSLSLLVATGWWKSDRWQIQGKLHCVVLILSMACLTVYRLV